MKFMRNVPFVYSALPSIYKYSLQATQTSFLVQHNAPFYEKVTSTDAVKCTRNAQAKSNIDTTGAQRSWTMFINVKS